MSGRFKSHVSPSGAVKSVDDMPGASFYYDALILRWREPQEVGHIWIATAIM